MVLSKLDLAIVATIAAGLLWFEHGQRVTIETASGVEVADQANSVCPDSDTAPYSAACLAFIEGGVSPHHARARSRLRIGAVASAQAAEPAPRGQAESPGPACPLSNESAPYSAKCIKFLSGWFWHPNLAESPPR
jgi:hypothetical protein